MHTNDRTRLHETDLGGIPCFWVESGRPTLTARLSVRHGLADEPLHESGWMHLLEHLALRGRGGGALQVDGSVGLLFADFDAHGPPQLVAEFLADLAQWLAAPDLAELDRERRVLAVEARQRGGAQARALSWRYGVRGPGVVSYGEVGLGRATPARLGQRAERVFTRGNVALALDGPPPPGLRLDLPDGPRLTMSPSLPCELRLPAAYRDPVVVMSGVVDRSSSSVLLPELLRRTLVRRLREEAGGAYSPWATYERVDRDHALVVAGADVSNELMNTVARTVFDDLMTLGRDGWVDDRLEELRLVSEQVLLDPHARFQFACGAARSHLADQPVEPPDAVAAQAVAVRPAEVYADLVSFRESLLMGVPLQADVNLPLPRLVPPSESVVADGGVRHKNWPAELSRLVVGDGRLAVTGDRGRDIELSSIAGVLTYPSGERVVIDDGGWSVVLDPREWRTGEQAVADLDHLVPTHLHLPQPPLEPGPRFVPLPPAQIWGAAVSRAAATRRGRLVSGILLILLSALIAVVVIRLPLNHGPLLFGCVFLASAGFGMIVADRPPTGRT